MNEYVFQGFIFDMDGTLVDSSAKVELVWRLWCERHGVDLAAVMAIQQGVRSEDTIRQIAPHLDIAAECAWIDELESTDCEGIIPMDGAVHLLSQIPLSNWTIATSASIRPAVARLDHCAIPIPSNMVCAEHVQQGKPAPDIYQLAAKNLGLDPRQCLAFEDAPAGILSALSAGCQVIQIGGEKKLHNEVLTVLPNFNNVAIHARNIGFALQFRE